MRRLAISVCVGSGLTEEAAAVISRLAASDSDGATDGSIRVKMNDLKPLREDWGPLRNIRPGDTIVIIDPRNMAYLAERVGH